MKSVFLIMVLLMATLAVKAQEQKLPVRVETAPTIFNVSFNPYYSYADQGQPMFINNSHFYNQGNRINNSFPSGNGAYMKPGFSNDANRDLFDRSLNPTGVIFSGYIPVREIGEAKAINPEE